MDNDTIIINYITPLKGETSSSSGSKNEPASKSDFLLMSKEVLKLIQEKNILKEFFQLTDILASNDTFKKASIKANLKSRQIYFLIQL